MKGLCHEHNELMWNINPSCETLECSTSNSDLAHTESSLSLHLLNKIG